MLTFNTLIVIRYINKEHINIKHSYSLIFFLIIFIIALHTWPIIMSTSNAMRQGLAMSFIFLALVSSLRKNISYDIMGIYWNVYAHFWSTSSSICNFCNYDNHITKKFTS